jgi:hypothetical protein
MKTLYAIVLAATAMACASVQPALVQTGDRCLRCRRPIGDVRLAGEIIDNMRAPFPFRTAGCMAKYVKANTGSYTAIFVTDHRTGKMLPASDAWFVPADLASPDGKRSEADYVAFRSRSDAEAFRTHAEPLLRWVQVVAEAPAN